MSDKDKQYDLIDSLVFDYQKGSEQAAIEILRYFGYDNETKNLTKYLNKYFSLLRFGVINFGDRDTRKFLRQFTSNEKIKQALIPYYQYASTKKATRKIVQMINYRMRHISDEDLTQDLCMLLLQQAKKFEKQKEEVNFCGYLYNSYRHAVYEYFKYLFRDLLYSHELDMLEDFLDENSEIDLDDIIKPDLYFEKERETLGFNWILGRSANYPFTQLNQFERTLLHLHDYKKMTYEQVGAQMGYHRDTIWSKRKRIKEKLFILRKETPCDWRLGFLHYTATGSGRPVAMRSISLITALADFWMVLPNFIRLRPLSEDQLFTYSNE